MIDLSRAALLAAAAVTSLFLVGCAGPAPHYAPSIDNVDTLKKAGVQASNVGGVTVAPGLPGGAALSLRGAQMVSPVGATYGDYLATALRQELELAKLFNARSETEISGALLRNNMDVGGISIGSGQMEARFIVKRGGQVRFDKVKKTEMTWESSFAGAVAVPLAANNYPVMVQQLIKALLADAEFIQSLRN